MTFRRTSVIIVILYMIGICNTFPIPAKRMNKTLLYNPLYIYDFYENPSAFWEQYQIRNVGKGDKYKDPEFWFWNSENTMKDALKLLETLNAIKALQHIWGYANSDHSAPTQNFEANFRRF